MKTRFMSVIVLLLFSFALFSSPLMAREYEYAGPYLQPETQSGFQAEAYDEQVGKKMERGLRNFAFGFLEIPASIDKQVARRREEYLNVHPGTYFMGFMKGTFRMLGRMGVGAYEVITFPYAQGPVMEELEPWESY